MPENALLSHDLFEGIYARTALVSDVEVVDDYPASVLAHARRQHRWVRGDWQILRWLFPWVRTARGGLERNRLPLICRWKILDNLRRSLVPPATLALLLAALDGAARERRGCGPLAVAGRARASRSTRCCSQLLRPAPAQQPWRVFLRGVAEELATALRAGARCTLAFLAYQAWRDGCTRSRVTLVRLAITQRRLLEWETAAARRRARAGVARGAALRAFLRARWRRAR